MPWVITVHSRPVISCSLLFSLVLNPHIRFIHSFLLLPLSPSVFLVLPRPSFSLLPQIRKFCRDHFRHAVRRLYSDQALSDPRPHRPRRCHSNSRVVHRHVHGNTHPLLLVCLPHDAAAGVRMRAHHAHTPVFITHHVLNDACTPHRPAHKHTYTTLHPTCHSLTSQHSLHHHPCAGPHTAPHLPTTPRHPTPHRPTPHTCCHCQLCRTQGGRRSGAESARQPFDPANEHHLAQLGGPLGDHLYRRRSLRVPHIP